MAEVAGDKAEDPCGAPPVASSVDECPVCFELMGDACPVRKLSCGHKFHHSCIQRWLQRNSSCPLCKAVTPETQAGKDKPLRIDLGHQEMARVVHELEDIFRAVHQVAGPDYPVDISGLAYNLCASLGYEDEEELEEALGCALPDFFDALPQFEVVWPDEAGESAAEAEAAPEAAAEAAEAAVAAEAAAPAAAEAAAEAAEAEAEAADETGAPLAPSRGPKARMLPEPEPEDPSQCRAKRISFTVTEREDLWRVVLQGSQATIEIPELEFAIRPEAHRRIDTIYNFIAAAVYNLGNHVAVNGRAAKQGLGGLPEQEAQYICASIDELNRLLDLQQTFTVVIVDPQGISDLKPLEGAHVEIAPAAS